MQALYKMVASFLSVALIFTSAAPSFAQTRSNSPFKVSGSNALENAVQRHVAQALDKAEDTWWVAQGEKLVASQCQIQGLPCILDVLFKAQQAAAKKDILQATVCDKDNLNCVPALAYAWGGVRYATQHLLYYQNKPIIETAPQFVELVSEYGLHSESDRQAAMRYFYDLIELAKTDCSNGSLEIGSSQNRADTRRANQLQTERCTAELAVMPALAVISKTQPEKKKAAESIYNVLESKYDESSGGAVITAGATALGVLGTPRAYTLLEKFLTQDTIPSTAGNMWEGLWSPGKSTAQNSLRAASNIRGGNSRYLNRINEQFQYLDKAEAKRQGFTNTAWQSEGRQYPYANVLEEVGAFIGQQSASNASAQKLAKKLVAQANETAKSKTNAAGTLHYPLVLGILDGWRTHGKKFIYEPDPALLSLFYKGDWFDINEGTQRHVHYKAYQFAQARGWTWKTPEFDKEKKQRYIYNARIMGMGEAADIVAPLLLVEGLFRIVPVLAKGIPTAVRTLRGRTALVGTKNYLQSAKVAKPISKEVPLKPAPAAQQVAPKPTKPAKLGVAKVDNKTAQILPEGYTVGQLNPGRTNIAPQTFTSQGAPVANTSKVQPAMAQTTEAVAAPAASNTAAAPKVTPKWIWGESTNTLGQTVPSMVPNPAHPEYVQMLAAQSGKVSRPFSWKNLWTDMQLAWQLNKPNFSQLLKFGTSRYGLAAAGPGAAPISSEAAIAQAADMPAVVQTVRTQQGMFIAEEFLRGGAGASYRIGTVNPGALALQNSAKTAATLVNLNPVTPFMKAAASVALTVGGGYTAAQMGLLPTDGSELLRLAMLPGLVVAPGAIKPMLQMAFKDDETGAGFTGYKTPEERKKAEQEAQELLASIAKNERELEEGNFSTTIGKSVLFIPNVALEKDPNFLQNNPEAVKGYSMTVVKTNYKGKEEIFGIIPTHSLPPDFLEADAEFGVMKNFQAQVKLPDGTEKLIPGEVVQVSPQSMLDISLVKFNPQDESLLSPLELADTPIQLGEPVFLYGRTNAIPASFSREIKKISFVSVRTDMIDAKNGQRQGFCGSPWTDIQNRVKAIHTGSDAGKRESFGTNVTFVKKLIEAYHNNGQAMYDLMLDGNVLTQLNIDEYISAFVVYGDDGRILVKEYSWHAMEKYSENKLRQAMALPHADMLVLYSRRVKWDKALDAKHQHLGEYRGPMENDEDVREHLYDIKNKQLLYTTDEVDNFMLQMNDFTYQNP